MARKPVNTISHIETRDALWAAIRAFKEPFTARDLRRETRCTDSQVSEYLKGLLAAGIVDLARDGKNPGNPPGTAHLYRLVDDRGPVAPRVRRDGSEVTQGQGRTNMWRVMRVLGQFTVQELAIHASTEQHQVKPGEADKYCQFLAQAGYLRRTGSKAYRSLSSRYSGPRAPMIQRIKQVYDPNLKKVVWSQGGDHDQD